MFETKIKFQGKERTIRFGSWVNGNIEKIVNKKRLWEYGITRKRYLLWLNNG